MDIEKIREQVNLWIYDSKPLVMRFLNIVGLVAALVAISFITVLYGFQLSDTARENIFISIQASFVFFIIRFFIRLFYDFHPRAFLRNNWFEAVMILLLILEGLSYNILGNLLFERLFIFMNMDGLEELSGLFFQIYIFIIFLIDLKERGNLIPAIKINPAAFFIFTFILLITLGSVLLMMPEMTSVEGSMDYLDALFTSTSAVCVTGLIVVDTGTFFTMKGHFVILLLMKLGGLNIISFGAFLSFFGKFGLGVKHHDVVEDFVFKDSLFSNKGLLFKIIISSITIEIIGSMFIAWFMFEKHPELSVNDTLFFSVFHAISAFNNAGFSTLTDGMYNEMYRHFYLLHLVLTGLIIVGTIGFDTLFDLFDKNKMRERLKHPWKRPKIGSMLNVYTSLILICIGTILFYLFESSNTMEGYSMIDGLVTSFFQVNSLRTAGFSSIDFHEVATPVIIMTFLFMFVGGGSTSTAGGIKTSTFSLLALSAYSTIRGKKRVEVFHRNVNRDIVMRAFSIFFFALSGVLIGTFLLTITEQHILDMKDRGLLDILFEQFSAFSTVGLSTGITPLLSSAGKVIIITSMFIGRLGTLTIAFAISKSIKSTNYKYPEEHMLVG